MSKFMRLLVVLITVVAFAASTVSVAMSADEKPAAKKPEKAGEKKDDKTKDSKAKEPTKKPVKPPAQGC